MVAAPVFIMFDPDEIIRSLTFDRCLVCGWVGLSDDVGEDNKCPQCGSDDMDDIDAEIYEED